MCESFKNKYSKPRGNKNIYKVQKIIETIKDNKVSHTRNLFEQEEEKDYYKAGKVDKVIK